jgi:hypothetical protein
MIHHKINNKQDPFWQLLLTLGEIIEMSIAPEHTQESIRNFRELVERHLNLFKENVRTFRPKQHKLTHYGSSIEQIGPITNYSALRGESNHQYAKRIAQSTSSRKNITKSILIKDSLHLAARALKNENNMRTVRYGKKMPLDDDSATIVRQLRQHYGVARDEIKSSKKVNYYGIIFKPSYVILEETENDRRLMQIKQILCFQNRCLLYCNPFGGFDYNVDIRAYISDNIVLENEGIFIDVNDVKYEPVLLLDLPSGHKAVKIIRKLEKG